ncbi:hypothetical protein [Nocardia cyriacigeorgica]|uniref:hypothetical protein n=1 Tax=Nocardia cyriacigeorgica TaxID=135487 RepID=UPI003D790FBA
MNFAGPIADGLLPPPTPPPSPRRATVPCSPRAHAQHFGGGYFDPTGQLWSADATLLATTHQMVYFTA